MSLVAEIAAAVVLAQGGARDPLDLLSALERDLLRASRANGERLQVRRAAKDAFDRELNRAVVRTPKDIWAHYNEYLGGLAAALRAFPSPDQRHERDTWIAACRAVLLKQASQARLDKVPTTAELFDACLEAVARARSKFPGEDVDDLLLSAYESVNLLFRPLLRNARAVPGGDPKKIHSAQLTLINARYGTSNEFPQRMLRDISKACMDRDVTARR